MKLGLKKIFLHLLGAFFLFSPMVFKAQETIGLTMGNYSGVLGAQLNPGALTGNKTFVDINILGASFHFSNNFAYIPKEDPAFFGPFPIDTIKPTYGDFYYNGYYTYYRNHDDKWVSLNAKLMGPSVMLQYKNHAFAFSTSLRMASSGIDIPWEIPVFSYEDLHYLPLLRKRFQNENFGLNALLWDEISFSYANEIFSNINSSLSIGITGKLLFGIAGIYNIYNEADYKVLDVNNVYYYHLDTEFAYSFEDDIDNINPSILLPGKANGFGLGFDVGVVYTKKVKTYTNRSSNHRICSFPYEDYVFKVGFSLLDVGSIKFKKNGELHHYKTDNLLLNVHNLPDFNDLETNEYFRYLSEVLTGDPDSSFQSTSFRMGLPSAASFQFDWHIYQPYYVSVLWVHPITYKLKNVHRPAQIALTPRYETQVLGISLPLSVINYHIIRTGLAIRIYNLTIGTESLGTLLDMRNLDNLDVYFSLKFNLAKGKCDPNKRDACSGWK